MRVLGVDPGSQYMGLGCVEKVKRNFICIGHQLICVKPKTDSSWVERIRIIYQSVSKAIELWKPEAAAVENIFLHKNANSALKLGQARGAAIAAIATHNLPLYEYSPRTIKQNITASGGADKQAVEQMVRLLLGASLRSMGEIVRSDVSDALAIALCHAQQLPVTKNSEPTRLHWRDLR